MNGQQYLDRVELFERLQARKINKAVDQYFARHNEMPKNIDAFINTLKTKSTFVAITSKH